MVRTDHLFSFEKLNEHDNGAFEQMFHCYYSALCFYADKIVKDNDLSRDIVQDVFLKFYEKKPVFDNIISLRTYLYRSVFNACINYIKKYNRSAPDDKFVRNVEVPESEDNYLYQLESRLLDEIFLGIKSLPDKCRQVFELSYIERCSIKEISRRLNISENTVKSQKARAKQLLKERLRDLYSLLSFIFF